MVATKIQEPQILSNFLGGIYLISDYREDQVYQVESNLLAGDTSEIWFT